MIRWRDTAAEPPTVPGRYLVRKKSRLAFGEWRRWAPTQGPAGRWYNDAGTAVIFPDEWAPEADAGVALEAHARARPTPAEDEEAAPGALAELARERQVRARGTAVELMAEQDVLRGAGVLDADGLEVAARIESVCRALLELSMAVTEPEVGEDAPDPDEAPVLAALDATLRAREAAAFIAGCRWATRTLTGDPATLTLDACEDEARTRYAPSADTPETAAAKATAARAALEAALEAYTEVDRLAPCPACGLVGTIPRDTTCPACADRRRTVLELERRRPH